METREFYGEHNVVIRDNLIILPESITHDIHTRLGERSDLYGWKKQDEQYFTISELPNRHEQTYSLELDYTPTGRARISIPSLIIERLNLEKRATLVGQIDIFELWNTEELSKRVKGLNEAGVDKAQAHEMFSRTFH